MVSAAPAASQRHNLGPIEQLPIGEGRMFLVGHVPVAVFRTRSGQVYATQALCTHKGGPLADGIIGGQTLVCPLHAYKFNLSTGQPIGHECKALKTYPLSVSEDGDILLTISTRFQSGEDAASSVASADIASPSLGRD
ncbi:MAG: Rieske 2Fe-2S domain-containing protein [Chloroflexi bacterium]|nr:Rieske 2Fe-2S domain-containing protein [Chloroflexota bacterium]